jgi:hypothetical protein
MNEIDFFQLFFNNIKYQENEHALTQIEHEKFILDYYNEETGLQ